MHGKGACDAVDSLLRGFKAKPRAQRITAIVNTQPMPVA